MAVIFPYGKNRILAAGYQEEIVDNILRTEFDTGTSEERLIRSRLTRVISASYHLKDKAEIDFMMGFYTDTITQGLRTFEWEDIDGVRWLVKLLSPIKIERKTACNNNNHAILSINIKLLEQLDA